MIRHPVVELRQYTLRPGQRDVLIELFDREFVESQETGDLVVLGQFRDLDDPDRFVWLRGFPDMRRRAEALRTFYEGPVWKAHRERANATMIDSDNVLLLRPVDAGHDFPPVDASRTPVGVADPRSSLLVATIYYRDRPFDASFVDFFDREVRPILVENGAGPLACLQTEHAVNTFPALPVRGGENVFVSFTRFSTNEEHQDHLRRLARSERWRDGVQPELSAMLAESPQQLRLAPTTRSLLR